MKKIFCFLLTSCLLLSAAYASPRQVIIIRHADKLEQKITGPALSAKGYIRSLKFGFYFLNNFGEPDVVMVADPKKKKSSIREFQTVAPLVNMIVERHPDTDFSISHAYTHEEYKALVKALLNDKKFNDALVLICWRHSKIAELANALGVTEKLNPWPKHDYDSVYVLDYDKSGKLVKFRILKNQYPVDDAITWDSVNARFAP